MDCPSTPAAPLFALTRLYASHTSCFGISNDLSSAPHPLQELPRYYEPVRQQMPRRYSTANGFSRSPLFLSALLAMRGAPVSASAFPRSVQKQQTGLAPPTRRTPPGQ